MPRSIPPPFRRREIIDLASGVREKYSGVDIEEVAERERIELIYESGDTRGGYGYSVREKLQRKLYIESLARPGERIPTWDRVEEIDVFFIVLNKLAPIPLREIFWHEYFHVFHSPAGVQRATRHYLTEGVLHASEERRANDLAAAYLIPSIKGLPTIRSICDRYGVSEWLAGHAVKLYSAVGGDQA